MNEVKLFENEEFGLVRTVIIDGEPWFVGNDVAKALGYSKTNEAIKLMCWKWIPLWWGHGFNGTESANNGNK